ncbi:MAG: hypothetical protein V3V99_04575 [candidate division Zixibacteria bacterium]
MLRMVHLEEIKELLFLVPGFIDRLEKKEAGIVSEINDWLKKMEKALTNNRLPLASGVATFRGTLNSAEQGVIPAGISIHGRITKRKIKEASAVFVLHKTNEIISNTIQEDIARFNEAENLAQQMVAVANAKGAIPVKHCEIDNTQYLKHIWRNLLADPELSPGTVRLEGLIGPHDSLAVLDRVLTVFAKQNDP